MIPYRLHQALWVQVLVAIWRWAIEILLLVWLVVVLHQLGSWFGVPLWGAFLIVWFGLVAPLALMPVTRPVVAGIFWCLLTRHRLRSFFVECRIFNPSGKLPWILTSVPTPVGERCWLWLMPGLSVEDFTGSTEQLASACWARSARVERSKKRATLVCVDVVRRDPLTAGVLSSILIPARVKRQRAVTAAATAGRVNELTSYPGSDQPATTAASSASAGSSSGAGVLRLPRRVIDLTTSTTPTAQQSPSASARSPRTRPSVPDSAPPNGATSTPATRGRSGDDVTDYI